MDRTDDPPYLRFGVFMAPFHRLGENPTLALERDLELLACLDSLGYDEAWIGEHHSAGWEIIGSPEVFIAAAAARTRHIRLGTGVVPLPYHNPFMVAERLVLLDHLTRGRVMLGVGPGAILTDTAMLGLKERQLRPRMAESLDVIVRLLDGCAPVSARTDWFDLCDARLQLRPYTRPHPPIAVASSESPHGLTLAGRHGARILYGGPAASVPASWAIAEEAADSAGRTLTREHLSLMVTVHLADSRREALEAVRAGVAAEHLDYWGDIIGLPGIDRDQPRDGVAERFAADGSCIIGTPDDCIAAIRRMQAESGGFGGLLIAAKEWARRDETLRSYELLARYVMPHFQGSLAGLEASAGHSRAFDPATVFA